MFKLFNKWLGINIELTKYNFSIDIGLWSCFYIIIDWSESLDFRTFKSQYSRSLEWKHLEIGVIY
jgi:hypothetical protein